MSTTTAPPSISTVSALGHNWITNSQPAPPNTAPPPASPPSLWVAGNVTAQTGGLQLALLRDSGVEWEGQQAWAAAQAVLQPPAGQTLDYGTYLVTVRAGEASVSGNAAWKPFCGADTTAGNNTSTTFGAFTFDPTIAAPYNEIDIVEIGYQNQNQAGAWIDQQPGGPAASNAQFALQPWDEATPGQPDWGYVNRIQLDFASLPADGAVTFVMQWTQGQPVSYYAAYGTWSSTTFPYDSDSTLSWSSTANAPDMTANTSLYLNLWPYGGPSTNAAVYFTVTAVEVPLASSSTSLS